MSTRWEIVTIVFAVAVGTGIWAIWRYWALRTWRTVAVCAVAALLAGAASAWSPYGVLIGLPIVGIALWLVASGHPLLMSMSQQDYLYAERLREADEEARRILTTRPNASPQAIDALDNVISTLSIRPPHQDWEQARAAKVEELSLARSMLVDMDTSREAAERLRARRADARRLFLAARRVRSGFWAVPKAAADPEPTR